MVNQIDPLILINIILINTLLPLKFIELKILPQSEKIFDACVWYYQTLLSPIKIKIIAANISKISDSYMPYLSFVLTLVATDI